MLMWVCQSWNTVVVTNLFWLSFFRYSRICCGLEMYCFTFWDCLNVVSWMFCFILFVFYRNLVCVKWQPYFLIKKAFATEHNMMFVYLGMTKWTLEMWTEYGANYSFFFVNKYLTIGQSLHFGVLHSWVVLLFTM
jgi:hypothetical protein